MGKVKDVTGREVDDIYAKSGGAGDELIPYARWVASIVDYRVLTAAATTDVVDLEISLPAGTCVHDVRANLVTTFEDPLTLSDFACIVGDATDPNGLVATMADLDDDGGTTGWQTIDLTALGAYLYNSTKKSLTPKMFTSATDLEATFTATGGGNVSTLTQGQLNLYFLISSPSAAALVNRATTQ